MDTSVDSYIPSPDLGGDYLEIGSSQVEQSELSLEDEFEKEREGVFDGHKRVAFLQTELLADSGLSSTTISESFDHLFASEVFPDGVKEGALELHNFSDEIAGYADKAEEIQQTMKKEIDGNSDEETETDRGGESLEALRFEMDRQLEDLRRKINERSQAILLEIEQNGHLEDGDSISAKLSVSKMVAGLLDSISSLQYILDSLKTLNDRTQYLQHLESEMSHNDEVGHAESDETLDTEENDVIDVEFEEVESELPHLLTNTQKTIASTPNEVKLLEHDPTVSSGSAVGDLGATDISSSD